MCDFFSMSVHPDINITESFGWPPQAGVVLAERFIGQVEGVIINAI